MPEPQPPQETPPYRDFPQALRRVDAEQPPVVEAPELVARPAEPVSQPDAVSAEGPSSGVPAAAPGTPSSAPPTLAPAAAASTATNAVGPQAGVESTAGAATPMAHSDAPTQQRPGTPATLARAADAPGATPQSASSMPAGVPATNPGPAVTTAPDGPGAQVAQRTPALAEAETPSRAEAAPSADDFVFPAAPVASQATAPAPSGQTGTVPDAVPQPAGVPDGNPSSPATSTAAADTAPPVQRIMAEQPTAEAESELLLPAAGAPDTAVTASEPATSSVARLAVSTEQPADAGSALAPAGQTAAGLTASSQPAVSPPAGSPATAARPPSAVASSASSPAPVAASAAVQRSAAGPVPAPIPPAFAQSEPAPVVVAVPPPAQAAYAANEARQPAFAGALSRPAQPSEAASGLSYSPASVQRRIEVAPVATGTAPVARSGEPVQRAIAAAVPMPPPPPARMDPPASAVQRVETTTEATGQIQSVTPEQPDNSRPSSAEMAEMVWPHIRRKLRIERERERGLPS